MFKHILVPLDGSERAEQALPIAAQIACTGGGTISQFRIVDVQEWMVHMSCLQGLAPARWLDAGEWCKPGARSG